VSQLPIPELIENRRRSVAMLPPGAPALNRDEALEVLQQLVDALSEIRDLRAPNLTPPEPALSADRAKRRQPPCIGPQSDRARTHREQFRYLPRREYVAVVVLELAHKRRCRFRFALPLRTRFALAVRTRSPLRCWCRRDALTEGVTDFG
jgi:hypothetical protein